jgi:hypothetical protein
LSLRDAELFHMAADTGPPGGEFGVDLRTEPPQYPVGSRPNCWPGYKEATAATNNNFSFWVTVLDGTQAGAADPDAIPWSICKGASTLSMTILATGIGAVSAIIRATLAARVAPVEALKAGV